MIQNLINYTIGAINGEHGLPSFVAGLAILVLLCILAGLTVIVLSSMLLFGPVYMGAPWVYVLYVVIPTSFLFYKANKVSHEKQD